MTIRRQQLDFFFRVCEPVSGRRCFVPCELIKCVEMIGLDYWRWTDQSVLKQGGGQANKRRAAEGGIIKKKRKQGNVLMLDTSVRIWTRGIQRYSGVHAHRSKHTQT